MAVEPSYHTEPTYGMRNALRLVLLFFAGGEWTQERRDEWRRLTGTREATTKVLCDHVRSALSVGAAGDAGEHEAIYGWGEGHVLSARDVEMLQCLLADHNDEIGFSADAHHLGRIDAFNQVGGQKLVDEMLAKDEATVKRVVDRAMERWRDMTGDR